MESIKKQKIIDEEEFDQNESTLVLIKPDAFELKKAGEVLTRLENIGLKITYCHLYKNVSTRLMKKHYQKHKDKPFFDPLIKFMTQGNIMVLFLNGKNAVSIVRNLQGDIDTPGTIRGDWADKQISRRNIIHASDTIENAKEEIKIWMF